MDKDKLRDPSYVKTQVNLYLNKGFLFWNKGNKIMAKKEKFKSVLDVTTLAAGLNNITYSIKVQYRTKEKDLGNRDYILRFVDNNNIHKVKNEVERMLSVQKLELPIPQLYIFEEKKALVGNPFIIMEKIEGEPAMECVHNFSSNQTRKFLVDLAHSLGVIHNVRSDKWDSYYMDKKTLKGNIGKKAEFPDYIINEIKTILNGFSRLNLTDKHDIDIQYLYKWFKGHAPLLRIDGYSLTHGDVRPSNIIVQYNSNDDVFLSGLIDWEMSCFSDPAQDLGWTLFFFKLYENLRKERGFFFKEYWKHCSKYNFEARVDFYETLAAIKLYTYAMSTKINRKKKYEKNAEFFNRVIDEVLKYLDRIMHRD